MTLIDKIQKIHRGIQNIKETGNTRPFSFLLTQGFILFLFMSPPFFGYWGELWADPVIHSVGRVEKTSQHGSKVSQSPIQRSFPHIDKLLFQIKTRSPDIEVMESEKRGDLISNEGGRHVFDIKGSLDINYMDEKAPQSSPFSTSSVNTQQYTLGFEKTWLSGFTSKLSYSIQNRENTFFSGAQSSFIKPTLRASVSTYLFQDLFYRKYKLLDQWIAKQSEAIEISKQVKQKGVLVKGLLDLSVLLIQEEELKFQESLCRQGNMQIKKLENKMKRQSISKREYYISLRESTKCQVSIEDLKNSLIEKRQNFESTFNISQGDYIHLDSSVLFKELEEGYRLVEEGGQTLDIESKDDIRDLSVQLEGLEVKKRELEARASSDLQLEFSVGASGLDDSFGEAHQDLQGRQFPFIAFSLKVGLPWSSPEAITKIRAHNYRLRAVEVEKRFLVNQSLQRLKSLKETLRNNFSIYRKYIKSVHLSESILKEARNDFNNGRIDFFAVTEFNKGLIQDQKNLSIHRLRLLIQVVEYLDYYNFFSRYLGEA